MLNENVRKIYAGMMLLYVVLSVWHYEEIKSIVLFLIQRDLLCCYNFVQLLMPEIIFVGHLVCSRYSFYVCITQG